MTNINYTLAKNYIDFPNIPTMKGQYYLQSWNIPGFSIGEAIQSTQFGPSYEPGDTIEYEMFQGGFVLDEDLFVYESLLNLGVANAPQNSNDYRYTITDINFHFFNNTYSKEIGYLTMYNAFIKQMTGITKNYSDADNTVVNVLTCLFRFSSMKFFRIGVNTEVI